MRLTIAILLLATAIGAEKQSSRSKQRTVEDISTEKRGLKERNAGVEKRVPLIQTAQPSASPGIEYADSKNYLAENSPAHQIYATPIPPAVAKISDVLAGQGPAFPAAIASHLYSPFSVYQARLASPTTYEVSAPIPSQLAYAGRISYQPVQYTPQVQYNQPRPDFFRPSNQLQTVYQENVQPIAQQQIPEQPVVFTPQPVHFENAQYQNLQFHNPQFQNIQYQNPQYQNPQAIYTLVQQRLAQLSQTVQPGQEDSGKNQAIQRELKTTAKPQQHKIQEKQNAAPEQNYVAQGHGAVSFASFSQGQQASAYQQQQPQTHQYQFEAPLFQRQEQHQPQAQYQLQLQPQPQYQLQLQPQAQPQYLIQTQPQYQTQTQYQTQNQPQYVQAPNAIVIPKAAVNAGRQFQIRPDVQPVNRPQIYQGQELAIQNQGTGQAEAVAPTFPPVQYFGKFAHDIFGYKH